MTLRTPNFGPHAGLLCTVDEDGTLTPVGEPEDSASAAPPVLLPTVGQSQSGNVSTSGELDGPDTRGNREQMRQSLIRTYGEQYAGWAAEKANNAVRNWDRGVRSGRIARKE